MATLADMAAVVARAEPAYAEDREILVETYELLRGNRYLKVGEVAGMVGASPGTVRNWLEKGYFGRNVYRSDDGTRLFRIQDVQAVIDRMERTRAENENGIVDIPDLGDRGPRRYRRRAG